jgi:hypothetical protein
MEWILASERKPDESVEVVALTDELEISIAWVEEDGAWNNLDGILVGVTHWVPIPRLPEDALKLPPNIGITARRKKDRT